MSRTAIDSDAPQVGSARLVPNDPVVANSRGRWDIVFRTGRRGVDKGGCVRFTIPYGFTPPQISYPFSIGFTTVRCSNEDVSISLSLADIAPRAKEGSSGMRGVHVYAAVERGALRPDDEVTLSYGSAARNLWAQGAAVQFFEQIVEFSVAVDADGDRSAPGGFVGVPEQPVLKVVADRPQTMIVVAPSVVPMGEPFRVGITLRDASGNARMPYEGVIALRHPEGAKLTHSLPPEGMGICSLAVPPLSKPGVVRLEACSEDGKLRGASNPVLCRTKAQGRIYWGDLHVMTGFSQGMGTPREAYLYGRDVAHLDFCCVTDGDEVSAQSHYTEAHWERSRQALRELHEPGRYVTILGSEYQERQAAGDKNIYYRSDDEPFLRHSDLEGEQPYVLWEKLRGREALTVPHHSMNIQPDPWEHHDPEFQRLVEIYSCWGSSECENAPGGFLWRSRPGQSVRAALNRGYRLGIVASSDSHDGHAGYSDWLRIRRGRHNGLAAVLAGELTREAIFDALWNRRCYGTNGERIILDFRLNGLEMGTEGPDQGATRKMEALVHGTEEIERIDIIRNGAQVRAFTGSGADMRVEWSDESPFDAIALPGWDGRPFVY